MGKRLDKLNNNLQEFIAKQKMFFVGTAMREGKINISPKGLDSLRVVGPNRVIWLNLTGSGNETAAQLMESPRMTLMFCAFEGAPLILRLYGTAKVYHDRDKEFQEYLPLFSNSRGARQIMDMHIEMVQTSCGYAVPLMEFQGERSELTKWTDKKSDEEIKDYWKAKNTVSLDGHPTNIFE